nr:hypothetical protein [Tanacetum cinerariifolium]
MINVSTSEKYVFFSCGQLEVESFVTLAKEPAAMQYLMLGITLFARKLGS